MNQHSTHHNASLRETLKQKRQSLDAQYLSQGALRIRARLYTWLSTQLAQMPAERAEEKLNLAAFWSLPAEPELQPLLNKWASESPAQFSLCLPCIEQPDAPLVFRPWTLETPMKKGAHNIPEPDSTEQAVKPDIILVPTLGYTRQGDRIGYGKGYYDRTLAALKAQYHPFVTIGIAWSCGDLSAFDYQPQAHDVPLDAILTEQGWAKAAPQL